MYHFTISQRPSFANKNFLFKFEMKKKKKKYIYIYIKFYCYQDCYRYYDIARRNYAAD